MSFSEMMRMGHGWLGKGRYPESVIAFDTALRVAKADSEKSQAYHGLGIAHRLSGKYPNAIECFERASGLASDEDVSWGRVLRDWAMVYIDQAAATRDELVRYRFVGEAEDLLRVSMTILKDLDEDVEAAVSEGFLARSFFIDGERAAALQTLRSVQDKLFKQHPVYELNNLIWLARVSFIERWRRLPYIAQLISSTGHSRRWMEYAVLLLGGNTLHTLLKEK